jgi:hypothetical protein
MLWKTLWTMGGLTLREVYVSSTHLLHVGKLLRYFRFVFNELHIVKDNFPLLAAEHKHCA